MVRVSVAMTRDQWSVESTRSTKVVVEMGCASSSPLVESGKNLVDTAKDSAGDVIVKGEKTLQDFGETAKEKITTEMDHVKEAMHSAMNTAENSIGSVMGKVGNSINATTTGVKEAVNNAEDDAEDALNVASEATTEAVSEAETVLASEVENVKETFSSATREAFETTNSTSEAMEDKMDTKGDIKEVLQIEDMDENFDGLGDSVNEMENRIEEIVTKLPTPMSSPVKEPKKEEPPPTFWEAAADAILHQRSFNKSVDIYISEPDIDGSLTQIVPAEISADNDRLLTDSENSENRVLAKNNGNDSVVKSGKENVYIVENNNE